MMAIENPKAAEKRRIQVKIYIVCMRRNLFQEGEINVQHLGAYLTRAAAQAVVDQTPGTFIVKLFASK